MRFVPMAGLINFRLRRLFYKVLHMAGRQHAGYAADFQNVVWAIRTADAKQNSWGDELGSAEKRLLNAAMLCCGRCAARPPAGPKAGGGLRRWCRV